MRRRVPLAVWTASAALAVVIAVQAALALLFVRGGQVGWGMYAFAALFFASLVTGIARGSRLAWLWGRYISIVLGAVVTASVVAGFVRGQAGSLVLALSLAGIAAPLFAAGVALSRPSAYAFYDLVCPSCGARTALGADLLFREARCRRCQAVW